MDSSYRPRNQKYSNDGGDIVYTKQYIARCIIGTAIYWVVSPLFLMVDQYVPEINTESELYAHWYYRVVVNTTWFPLA